MNQLRWYAHFKDQLQGLDQAFKDNKAQGSLLKYALDNQYLSIDQYLFWAKEYYKFPILNSNFFSDTPISKDMFDRWAPKYHWSDECLPVSEWDGVLIVACLQPPLDFPNNFNFTFVIASSKDLIKAWKKTFLKACNYEWPRWHRPFCPSFK